MDCVALIVAGGSGLRIGGEIPKQYLKVRGETILALTLAAFCAHPQVDAVRVVIGEGHEEHYKKVADGFSLLPFAYGGATRQESVKKGLISLKDYAPRKVLIHDAARPFASSRIISEVIAMLDTYKAVDVGIDVTDTIKIKPQYGAGVLEREKLYATQTPQGFDFKTILALHELTKRSFTDDISIAIESGITIGQVNGDAGNFKITNPIDIA